MPRIRTSEIHAERIPRAVWVFAFAWTAVLAVLTNLKAWALYASAFDLGYFAQALGTVAQEGVGAPASMTGWSFLQDHFSPLALPLALLVNNKAGSQILLVVQAVAVGLSIPVAWRLASSRVTSVQYRWGLTLSYALAPTLLFALWFDFHPTLLCLPFLLLFLDGIERNEYRQGLLGALGTSLAREDLALLVVVISLFFFGKKHRWLAATGVMGLVVGVTGSLLSGGGGAGWFTRAGFSYVDLNQPLETIRWAAVLIWWGGSLVPTVLSWLLPWLFFGRLAIRPLIVGVLTSMPYLVSVILTAHVPGWHYHFYFAPLGLWAATRGFRSESQPPRIGLAIGLVFTFALGPLGSSAIAPLTVGLPEVLSSAVTEGKHISEAHSALACVPATVTQTIAQPFVPFVAHHRSVYVWPTPTHALQLFPFLPPILPQDEQARLPSVAVVGSDDLDRSSLFSEFKDELRGDGYQQVLPSPKLVEIWVLSDDLARSIAECWRGNTS